jgi:hypothetical protein
MERQIDTNLQKLNYIWLALVHSRVRFSPIYSDGRSKMGPMLFPRLWHAAKIKELQ